MTGASSGLGDRFARVLHAAGAHVVVAARRAERLDSLAASLGDRVTPVPTDLTVETDRVRLVEVALEVTGTIDVLVNNAGHSDPTPAEAETLEHFGATMDINVVAAFHLCQLVGTPDAVRRTRQHRERGIDPGPGGGVADEGRELLRVQGRAGEPDPTARLRVGPQGHPRQRPGARIGSPRR